MEAQLITPKTTQYTDNTPAKTRVDEDGRTRKDVVSGENWVWNAAVLQWERMTQPGAGAGGGPATIADGADVAQGTTTDVAWVSGAGTLIAISKAEFAKLEAIRALLAGTLTVNTGLTDAQLRATPVPVSGTLAVNIGLTDAQLRASAVPVSHGGLTDAQLRAVAVPVSGTVSVNVGLTDAQLRASAVPVDTELPAAAALSDNVANPTTPMTGSGTMLWDISLNAGVGGWVRAVGTVAAGLKVQSGQLPAALAAGGGLKVEGVAGGVVIPISMATNTPDVTDRAARLVGVVSGAANIFHVDDNAGSLTVDAPVGTPVFTRLSDGAAALIGQKVMATSLPIVVASDQSVLPVREQASTLIGTTISVANTTVTLTLAAVAASFHYITAIEIVNINATITAIAAAATLLAYTTTNLPGAPAWSAGTLLAAGTEKVVVRITFNQPIKSSVLNTATTFVAPAIGVGGQCRITVYYYSAA